MALHIKDPEIDRLARELAELIARGRLRAVIDGRPEEEILGYDSQGLPE